MHRTIVSASVLPSIKIREEKLKRGKIEKSAEIGESVIIFPMIGLFKFPPPPRTT